MKLPNSNRARVDREKIIDYLLSLSHDDGYSKAVFFMWFGFRIEDWQVFRAALQKHGASYQVVRVVESSYGTRYSIDGEIETPDGRNPYVRTVWIIEEGDATPRLVTAYPARRYHV